MAKKIGAQSYEFELAFAGFEGRMTVTGVTVHRGRVVDPNTGDVSDIQVKAVIRNDTKSSLSPTTELSLLDADGSVVLKVDPHEAPCLAPGGSERVSWTASEPAEGMPYYEAVSVEDRDTNTC